MISGIADTHTALWYLYADPRLSKSAREFIDSPVAQGLKIALSSISLAEVVYLVEKRRVAAGAYTDLSRVLNDPDHVFEEVGVDQQIVSAMHHIAREDVPDLPDRLIAATGLHFGLPVISRDGHIRASNVHTIW